MAIPADLRVELVGGDRFPVDLLDSHLCFPELEADFVARDGVPALFEHNAGVKPILRLAARCCSVHARRHLPTGVESCAASFGCDGSVTL